MCFSQLGQWEPGVNKLKYFFDPSIIGSRWINTEEKLPTERNANDKSIK